MKKAANILFVIAGMLFLAAAMVITIVREKDETSYFENRALASMPELESETILDGTYFTDLETYLEDNAAGRTTLLRWKTRIDLLLQRPVVNDIVVTEDEDVLVAYSDFEVIDEEEMQSDSEVMTEYLSNVNDVVTSYGGYYLYVAVPTHSYIFQEEFPWYLNSGADYIDLALDILEDDLTEAGVPWFDLGTIYYAQDDPQSYYYKKDHHFTMFAAFLAYQSILEEINEETGAEIPILQEEDVTFTEIENYFLGSRGRKLFDLIPSTEHLYALSPVNVIEYTRYDNGVLGDSTTHQWLTSTDETVTYAYYMGGDIAETVIETGREDYPDILIYGASYTNAIETVLYLSCDTMYSLDLRYYEGSLSEYIEENQPDYVICLTGYSEVLNTEDYEEAG